MRILQVAPFFSPKMGGSPQVVYHISKELCNKGHSVTVIAGDYGLNKSTFPSEGFNTVALRSLISWWGFYVTPSMSCWCQKHIREFDIIHLHEVRTYQNIILHSFAMYYKIPFVLSAHGTLPVIVQRKFGKRLYDLLFGHRILNSTRRLIAVSPVEESQYLALGIDKGRIRMIFNGLDLKEYSYLPIRGEFRSGFGIDEKTKIVLYLGRLHKIKGIDVLIEAFSVLKNNVDNILLLIAGPDDGDLSRLKSIVDIKGLGNQVRFIGPLYNRNKLTAYVDADVLASPGIYEIFGLVPFEALLCGTPVVVTNDCGSGQLINPAHAGYTVPYGDVKKLADTLLHVLENPEEAKQKIMAGQWFIREQLDWEKVTGQLENLYHDCIHQK